MEEIRKAFLRHIFADCPLYGQHCAEPYKRNGNSVSNNFTKVHDEPTMKLLTKK